MKRGGNYIKSIELETVLYAKEFISDYSNKTRLIGIFNIGFAVSAFDRFINYHKENTVVFQGNVVINELTGKRMTTIEDSDENGVQLFENLK